MPLDGIYINKLKNELAEKIVGTRVEKVYEPSFDELVFVLRGIGFSGKLLVSARGGAPRVNITKKPPENPLKAPMFCMLLRKYLGGAKIVSVETFGFERVLKFTFLSRNEMGDEINPSLVVELISASPNIIFLDNDGKIIDSVRRSSLEDNVRVIAPGARYKLPDGFKKYNILEDDGEVIIAELKKYESKPLFKAIMSTVDGVSPLVAREIAFAVTGDTEAPTLATSDFDCVLKCLKNAIAFSKPYLIYNPDKTPRDISFLPIKQYGSSYESQAVDSYSELLDIFYSDKQKSENIRRIATETFKFIENAKGRAARKTDARLREREACRDREKFRIWGELIKANIYAAKRGDTSIKVINYYDPNASEITIPLKDNLSPADNAQRYFKEYKKLCNAEKTLDALIADSQNELEYLETVLSNLERAKSYEDLALIRYELFETGYIKRPKTVKKEKKSSFKPIKFTSSDGFTYYVGRNNIQNDELTLKFSDKKDIWLHTKDIHGSHVIIVTDGREVPDTTLVEAAQAAAYYSKAVNSDNVPVDYTFVKFVKKPSGAKPGMVIYTNNKTLYVTPKINN